MARGQQGGLERAHRAETATQALPAAHPRLDLLGPLRSVLLLLLDHPEEGKPAHTWNTMNTFCYVCNYKDTHRHLQGCWKL